MIETSTNFDLQQLFKLHGAVLAPVDEWLYNELVHRGLIEGVRSRNNWVKPEVQARLEVRVVYSEEQSR